MARWNCKGQSCKVGSLGGAGWQGTSGCHRHPSLQSDTGWTFRPEEPTEPWNSSVFPQFTVCCLFQPMTHLIPQFNPAVRLLRSFTNRWALSSTLLSLPQPGRLGQRTRGTGWGPAQAQSWDIGNRLSPSLDTELASSWNLSPCWRLNSQALSVLAGFNGIATAAKPTIIFHHRTKCSRNADRSFLYPFCSNEESD